MVIQFSAKCNILCLQPPKILCRALKIAVGIRPLMWYPVYVPLSIEDGRLFCL